MANTPEAKEVNGQLEEAIRGANDLAASAERLATNPLIDRETAGHLGGLARSLRAQADKLNRDLHDRREEQRVPQGATSPTAKPST